MSMKTKALMLLIAIAAIFSGSTHKLLKMASQAVVSDAFADDKESDGSGASCGGN